MASKLIAIIAGVGPGTGAAVARKFAASYPVVLLARSSESYNALVKEINGSGGKAVGISTDVANADSVKNASNTIKQEFGDQVAVAAAVFNASGRFVRKPFLELTEDDFFASLDVSARGAFLFSRAVLPLLLNSLSTNPSHPPSLIFTGATASVKANAQMSSFATGKYAQRALSASLAKEFGPQGVHVSHVIVDGVIDIPRTKEWLQDHPAGAEAKISADAIADAYWYLHAQPKTAFTWELDVRPFVEKW